MVATARFDATIKYNSGPITKAIRDMDRLWKSSNRAQLGIKGMVGAAKSFGLDSAKIIRDQEKVFRHRATGQRSLSSDAMRAEKEVQRLSTSIHRQNMAVEKRGIKESFDQKKRNERELNRFADSIHRANVAAEKRAINEMFRKKKEDERKLEQDKKQRFREEQRRVKQLERERIRSEKKVASERMRAEREAARTLRNNARTRSAARSRIMGGVALGVGGSAISGGLIGAGVAVNGALDLAALDRGVSEVLTLNPERAERDPNERARVRDLIQSQSVRFGQETGSTQKALYDIISAGASNAAEEVAALNTANKLAVGGVTEVSVAADGLTSALNSWGIGFERSTEVADTFFQAVRHGKTTVGELASQIGRVGSTAAAVNISMDETFAAIATATKSGIRTEQAVSGVEQFIANIQKPTADAIKEAKRLGIDFSSTSLEQKGIGGFLKDIGTADGFNNLTLAKLFGSETARGFATKLLANDMKALAEGMQLMANKAGAAQKAFELIDKTDAQAISRMTQELKSMSVEIGKTTIPVLRSLMDTFGPAMKSFSESIAENPEQFAHDAGLIAKGIAGLAALSFLPSVVGGITLIGKAFTGLGAAGTSLTAALGATKAVGLAGALAVAGTAVAGLTTLLTTFFVTKNKLEGEISKIDNKERSIAKARRGEHRSVGRASFDDSENIESAIKHTEIFEKEVADAERNLREFRNSGISILDVRGQGKAKREKALRMARERLDLSRGVVSEIQGRIDSSASFGITNSPLSGSASSSTVVNPKFNVEIHTDGQNVKEVKVTDESGKIVKQQGLRGKIGGGR